MKMKFGARALVAGMMMTAITATADAATQGSLGSTSTGTVGLSATIPARVQITGLSDLAFGTLDPSSAASSSENVCVWSNTATKGYNLTATGDGGSSAFTLTNGTTTLAYAVEWAGTSGQTSGSALTTNTPKTGLTSTATAPNCSSSTTASLVVKFSTAQMQAAVGSATAYTGALTLVVAPE
jgi:hypothetical protein